MGKKKHTDKDLFGASALPEQPASTPFTSVSVRVSLLVALLLRWTLSLWGYSGLDSPPMYGDFEAQRHWLEITTQLPTKLWYRYDLQYWGLDYPPLTAYHSLLLGYIANAINPSWVALDASRGNEDKNLKMFMRYTAIVTDLIVNMSAIVVFCKMCSKSKTRSEQNALLLLALIQPGLLLIDHGHFQYNSAMLGFTLWFVVCMAKKQYALGSVFFCLALGFKQMALYYALPVFFYLLGVCAGVAKRSGAISGLKQLTIVGMAVLLTMGMMFSPFMGSFEDVGQVIHRIFPVGRGLYEDKVANFWCAISIVIKMKVLFTTESLVRISIGATLLAVLPSSIHLFYSQLSPPKIALANPSRKLLLALLNGSLAFFLFSFQVHEKSILIPLMPATMLLAQSDGLAWEGSVFITTAVFSMFPLLRRDGLAVPTVALTLLFNILYGFPSAFESDSKPFLPVRAAIGGLYALMSTLVFCESFVNESPVPKLPDLYTVVNALVSFGVFGLLFLRYNYVQLFMDDPVVVGGAKKKTK
ncbi:glycosyl transferase [Chytriomyces cf. hyalinus JEL632]|nr:glycosyl transferase [Chytriomyces cf. hyalinus JEL632]